MSIITVFKTEIHIGSIAIDAYTANQISSTTGKFINYLSGAGLAESIGLHRNTTLQNRLSEDLKAMLGAGFTTLQGKCENTQKSFSKMNLWDTTSAAIYYRYHDKHKNVLAGAIVTALISTTIDIIIDDSMGRMYQSGEAAARVKARLAGKYTRRSITDACKSWYDRPDVDCPLPLKDVIASCTNQTYMARWGVTAAEIRSHFGLKPGTNPPTRDSLSADALKALDFAEAKVCEAIDEFDAIPHIDAVQIARVMPAKVKFYE
jgi:hypothetical protein